MAHQHERRSHALLVPENSLITPGPESVRELAIRMARLTIKAM
ncbi:MAG: hypothetical protein WHT63_01200 [Tepidiforma sp.]|jgi:hypothetical protein|nr:MULTISPECIES: hypothetical protein [Tepidiforma]